MDGLIEVVIAIAAAAILLIAALVLAAAALTALWRMATQSKRLAQFALRRLDDAPLPLLGMLRRRELTPAGLDALAHEEVMALAVKRCLRCDSKARCREWLAAGIPADALPACPNAGLFLT